MKNDRTPVKVMVPYYGFLVRAGKGLEQVYFLAEVDPVSGAFENLSLQIWNPKQYSDLVEWFASQGVRGLVCRDSHPEYEATLAARDIRVCWAREGDLPAVIEYWTRERAA